MNRPKPAGKEPAVQDKPPTDSAPAEGWTIVVPFKGGTAAKSRLGHDTEGIAGLRPKMRHRLALAFLRDTIAAAAAVPGVADIVIVSSDPALLTATPDIILLADPGRGLNIAATAGIDRARSLNPHRPVAVLTGDLPCLDSRDLAAALSLAAKHPLSVVPDSHGSGSTMICALAGIAVSPQFGLHSFLAHVRSGHTVLPVPPVSTLRRDVDSVEDLHQALQQGVGKYTRSAVLRPGAWTLTGRLANSCGPLPVAAAI